MASTRQIIMDLRAKARAVDGRHLAGTSLNGHAYSMRRAADELERLLDELVYLRGFAEAVLEAEAGELAA